MPSEKPIQSEIFKSIGGRPDVRVFRNNVGMARHTGTGQIVKYGVCNPGGADLIGWTIKRITRDMVGKAIAIFTAIECKRPGKKPSDAQDNFLNQVKGAGGISGVARSEADANKIIDNYKK